MFKRMSPAGAERARHSLSLAIGVLAAFALGAVIILATGHNPLEAYGALLKGSFGSLRAIGNTGAKTVTLCLTGLAMAVAARAGMFNVGGEGQLYLGAIASSMVGVWLRGCSAWIVIPCAILAAVLAGGFYAFIPAVLKAKLKVNEVITTIMLNSAAILFCSYLVNGPFKTSESGIAAGTDALLPEYRLAKLIPLSNLTTSIFIAAGLAFIVWYMMRKSVTGYEMQLTGQNERFARYMGIKTDRLAIISMIVSGALCALVGMFEVYGLHGRFIEEVSNEFYFDGMLVAMIMRYQPVGIMLMSVFFAAIEVGSASMELAAGVSSELVSIIQSIIIFFMAAETGVRAIITDRNARKALIACAVSDAADGGESNA
ncbi:MAG: ABC transporter permease [Clostridia bacterium]|nr:ABC transporter permease [Clostridia bacterium]